MPKSDPTLDLAAAAIASDAHLKARVNSLVITAIDRLERTIKTGAPSEVTQALRAFIPAMARALTAEHTDDKLERMKADLQEMWAEMLEPYGLKEAQEQMEVLEDLPPSMGDADIIVLKGGVADA